MARTQVPLTVSACNQATDPPLSQQRIEDLRESIKEAQGVNKKDRKDEKINPPTERKTAAKGKAKAKAQATQVAKGSKGGEETDSLDGESLSSGEATMDDEAGLGPQSPP